MRDYLKMKPEEVETGEDVARIQVAVMKEAHAEYMKTLKIQQEGVKTQVAEMKKLVNIMKELATK